MKKIIVLMMAVATLAMTACGGDQEKVITGNSNNAQVENNQSGDNAQTDNSGAKGYTFKAQDVEIAIDGEAAPYLASLGEPASYYEAKSCAFDDYDKFYTYNGFEVDTYSMEGVEYVLTVALLDDSVSTQEGLCIGDSADKMVDLYGTPTTESETSAVYVKDGMKLSIILSNGVVASIEYTSTILD